MTGWNKLASISYASIEGIQNAPDGFVRFAREHGAIDKETPTQLEDEEVSFSQQFRVV